MKWIFNKSTLQLALYLVCLGAIPLIILTMIAPEYEPGNNLHSLLISLTFFIWGLIGIPIIIRKELPGIPGDGILYKIYSVTSGIIMVLSGIMIASIPVWENLLRP